MCLGAVQAKDLSYGIQRCSLIADHVYQWFSEDKEMSMKIRDAEYFSWTPQPDVRIIQIS